MSAFTTTIKSIQTAQGLRYLGWMSVVVLAQGWGIDAIASLYVPNYLDVWKIHFWWLSVIVLPIFETLVFQAFGCWVLDLFGIPRLLTLFITALVFGLAHYLNQSQWIDAFSAGVTGFIFSWMYLRRLREGRPWQGCAEVAFVHIVNNGIAYFYLILFAPETILFVS